MARAASLEQIADFLAAAPVADFFGRSEGVLAGSVDWAVRSQWRGAELHFVPEGAVPAELREQLASATKQPATAREWLAWTRTVADAGEPVPSEHVAGVQEWPAIREAIVVDALAREELDVATLAMLVGRAEASASCTGDRWVLTARPADLWLSGIEQVELVISGAGEQGVARSASAPGACLCAELDPAEHAWFVRAGGVALWWPAAGTTLELSAGDRRWRIRDGVAEAARVALCGEPRR